MRRRLPLISRSADDTRTIGGAVARILAPGDVVALSGDLGAGKTCFVQGAAAELGVADRVTSPSFVLLREYQGRLPVLHLDVYRMGNLQELVDLGFEEFLDPSQVMFIEWGDAVGPLLPKEYLQVDVHALSEHERRIELVPFGPQWTRRLGQLRADVDRFVEAS